MCGRFALPGDVRELSINSFSAKPRDLDRWPSLMQARYNICPTQPVAAIRLGDDGREAIGMRWGFIPAWYKTPTDGPLIINARSETIADKPAFRDAARQRRCLIPASGFYEWQGPEKPKTPYYIAPADGACFAFAGVWQSWTTPEGEVIDTCAIVTCAANDALAPIHHRMPVVIPPDRYGKWLGEEGKGAALLMQPAAIEYFAFYEVGPAIGSNRADGAELMEPL